MNKILIILLLTISGVANAQKLIKVGKSENGLKLKRTEEKLYSIKLKKNRYYAIVVEQQGIDVVITLKNSQGGRVEEKDSPNGQNGPEKIIYSPDATELFSLLIKPLDEKENSIEGKYAIRVTEVSKNLKTFTNSQLNQDFDILQNALIETKVGLWYSTYSQFDSICRVQRKLIKNNMNSLEFYKIVSPIVAYTKEGHSNIRVSDELSTNIKQNGKYFPFLVKILDGKVYLINDLDEFKTKGLIVTKINNNPIEKILESFLKIEPSDGFNLTSKYKWIETAFSKYYLRFFEFSPESFTLELMNPKTNEKLVYKAIPLYGFKAFSTLASKVQTESPNYSFQAPALFAIDKELNMAILTINDMGTNVYENGRKGFQSFLAKSFNSVEEQKISNLVIDLRKCEGGTQGMEDHLLAYLIDKEYQKYKYVEIPAFNYSFIDYTDYSGKEKELTNDLKTDFYQASDGRFLNKKGHYEGEKPQAKMFKGNIYVLIGGLTFSGGSELAALIKNYTNAVFIGEETGGGYYGNTSGSFIAYTLPNTELSGRIPLCKFVVETNKNDMPFGSGLLPDFSVKSTIDDYFAGYDKEMEFIKNKITEK